MLSRKIFFDRVTLTPYRQIVYDKQGNVATIADYADYRDFNGIRFRVVGDIAAFDDRIIELIRRGEELTAKNTGHPARNGMPIRTSLSCRKPLAPRFCTSRRAKKPAMRKNRLIRKLRLTMKNIASSGCCWASL